MDEQDTYLTITKQTEGFYKEKGSKFLGYAIPVENVEEVKEKIDALLKEHHNARHVCFAHIIGVKQPQIRANDDGEPSNSAGTPILNQIRSFEVTNTLVAVVRYYGGTKLGVPGLINAYKTAAREALENNTVEKRYIEHYYSITESYENISLLNRILEQQNVRIVNQDFGSSVSMTFAVRTTNSEQLLAQLTAKQLSEPIFIKTVQ
jgi:uncharacterized YigZ family protein